MKKLALFCFAALFSLNSHATLIVTFANDGSGGVLANFLGSGVSAQNGGASSTLVIANVGDAFKVNSQSVTLDNTVNIGGATLTSMILDDDPGVGDDFLMYFDVSIPAGTHYSVNHTTTLSGVQFADLNIGTYMNGFHSGIDLGPTTIVIQESLSVPAPLGVAAFGLGLMGLGALRLSRARS